MTVREFRLQMKKRGYSEDKIEMWLWEACKEAKTVGDLLIVVKQKFQEITSK